MSDLSSAMPTPEQGNPTLPVEGVRRRTARTGTRADLAALLPVERTAGIMVLVALGLVWLLRVLFRGALGD